MQHAQSTATVQEPWTVLSLLEWASAHLAEKGFDEARLHVELLLGHALHLSRIELYMQFDRPLRREELDAFRALYTRRLAHEPLQYIVGETEFMGLPLFVDSSVLIPRPETELLVERAVESIAGFAGGAPEVLDIGTGSGNVAIALAHFAPAAAVTSIDISAQALEVARRNMERNNTRGVQLERADIFEDVLRGRAFDLIVSNPPYVSADEFSTLQPEVREFEPRFAASDDGDGYRFIRRIGAFAAGRLRPGGFLFMEIGFGQAAAAGGIVEAEGLSLIRVSKDYAGIPRIVEARARCRSAAP